MGVVKSGVALVTTVSLASGWLYFLYALSGPDVIKTFQMSNLTKVKYQELTNDWFISLLHTYQDRLKFPRDLEGLKELKGVLDEYAERRPHFTLAFFVSAYLYKQSFAIPGSVFLVS
jgi:hypothetical protein